MAARHDAAKILWPGSDSARENRDPPLCSQSIAASQSSGTQQAKHHARLLLSLLRFGKRGCTSSAMPTTTPVIAKARERNFFAFKSGAMVSKASARAGQK